MKRFRQHIENCFATKKSGDSRIYSLLISTDSNAFYENNFQDSASASASALAWFSPAHLESFSKLFYHLSFRQKAVLYVLPVYLYYTNFFKPKWVALLEKIWGKGLVPSGVLELLHSKRLKARPLASQVLDLDTKQFECLEKPSLSQLVAKLRSQEEEIQREEKKTKEKIQSERKWKRKVMEESEREIDEQLQQRFSKNLSRCQKAIKLAESFLENKKLKQETLGSSEVQFKPEAAKVKKESQEFRPCFSDTFPFISFVALSDAQRRRWKDLCISEMFLENKKIESSDSSVGLNFVEIKRKNQSNEEIPKKDLPKTPPETLPETLTELFWRLGGTREALLHCSDIWVQKEKENKAKDSAEMSTLIQSSLNGKDALCLHKKLQLEWANGIPPPELPIKFETYDRWANGATLSIGDKVSFVLPRTQVRYSFRRVAPEQFCVGYGFYDRKIHFTLKKGDYLSLGLCGVVKKSFCSEEEYPKEMQTLLSFYE